MKYDTFAVVYTYIASFKTSPLHSKSSVACRYFLFLSQSVSQLREWILNVTSKLPFQH